MKKDDTIVSRLVYIKIKKYNNDYEKKVQDCYYGYHMSSTMKRIV